MRSGKARERRKAGRATGGRTVQGRARAAERPQPLFDFAARTVRAAYARQKGKTTMKEAMEAMAAFAMIAAVMGLAYAAGCLQ